jgi:uncharacterized protein YcbK (DUF882 family)
MQTTYFRESEFNCKCCGKGGDKMDKRLLKLLDAIRGRLGAPIVVVSGYRCVAHNTKVGGAKNSYHTRGMAVDIITPKMGPRDFYEWLENNFKIDGHGSYKGFNHIDVRGSHARWRG